MNLSRSVEILCLVILPVISYFIGNISPATLVGRLYGVDIRKEGSGNPGTTNVLRTLGKKEAAATLLVDVLKGFLPTFAAGLAVSDLAAILCATAALLGHMWPVCFRFQGGKRGRYRIRRGAGHRLEGGASRVTLRGARRTSDETDVLRIDIRCGIFSCIYIYICLSGSRSDGMGIYLGGMHGGADHLAAQKEYRQADSQRRAAAEFSQRKKS